MESYSPIVLFAYKRLDKVSSCLESLERCIDADKTDLFIFCDGYKGDKDKEEVLAVQEFIKKYGMSNRKFQNINISLKEKNTGLAKSIIGGVTEIIDKYESVIIIEDDLIFSDDFIQYMNKGIAFYGDDKRVGAIGGFTPSDSKICIKPNGVVKSRMGCCLGWATWHDRWNSMDWSWDINSYSNLTAEERKKVDKIQYGFSAMLKQQALGEIDSWAVRWDYHFMKNEWWTIYPNKSKVSCIGFDASSTHAVDEHDKRSKVIAESEETEMISFEDVVDVSAPMRAYAKPSVWEKIRYFLIKRKIIK